jgi:predicted transcriptional regulator
MDDSRVLNQWQIEEIKKALTEANCGDFASDDEVKQIVGTGCKADLPLLSLALRGLSDSALNPFA